MRGLSACGLLAVLVSLAAADPAPVVLELRAGEHERRESPIIVPLPEGWNATKAVKLVSVDDQQEVPAQRVDQPKPALVWILEKPLAAGSTRRYRLEAMPASSAPAKVTCRDDGKSLLIAVEDRPVLRYHHATLEPPPAIDPVYRRSGFIHPLVTPSGRTVTDDFAPDHAHQHGLFFAWVNTTFQGHRVDFWNQKDLTGRVRHTEIGETSSGPVSGGFQVHLLHEDITKPSTPVAVLNETWNVRAYRIASVHIVDIESRQTCAGPEPLILNPYIYGGFGLRGNRAWFDPSANDNDPPSLVRNGQSDFLTSDGKRRQDGNHTRPRWVDLSGLVDGKQAGITVLNLPTNFRSPQPVRLHPNKPYFSISPVVVGKFAIEPGQPYVTRYRLVIHDGAPDPSELDRLRRDFTEPPTVSWINGQ